MEAKTTLIETLYERATDYGKTSFEFAKLKTVEKTSEVVSSLIPHSAVFILFASFLIFFNLGLAFWIGELLGKTFFGFFVIAGCYIMIGLVLHFFLHAWMKGKIRDYIIKQLLK